MEGTDAARGERRERRMPAVLRGRRPSAFGLFATHVWIYCVLHRANLDTGSPSVEGVFYGALSLFLVLVAVASYRRRPRSDGMLGSVATAVLMIPATFVLVAPTPFSSDALLLVAAACGGVGIGWCYLQWGSFYAKLDIADAVACVFVSLIAGSAAKAVVNYLPFEAAAVVLALCPLATLLMCRDARRHAPEARLQTTHYNLRTIHTLWKIMLGVAIYGFIVGIVRGSSFALSGDAFGLATTVHHLVEVAMGAFMLVWVFRLGKTLDVANLWRIVVVVTMVGLLTLSLAGPELGDIAYMTIATAQTFIVMFFWLMLADIAHHSELHPFTVFSAGWVAYALPMSIGIAIASAVPEGVASSLVILLAYLSSTAMIFLLNDKNFSSQRLMADLSEPPLEVSAYEAIDQSCVQMGREFGLTPREVETMQLLCKGRSKSFIAEAFSLSENTVRSHSKNLYRKLGVHSVQEMLALITRRWAVPIDAVGVSGPTEPDLEGELRATDAPRPTPTRCPRPRR